MIFIVISIIILLVVGRITIAITAIIIMIFIAVTIIVVVSVCGTRAQPAASSKMNLRQLRADVLTIQGMWPVRNLTVCRLSNSGGTCQS